MSIAAKKAWIKIYEERGERDKAEALRREVERLLNQPPRTRPQIQLRRQRELERRLGRPLTAEERLRIIHELWGGPGEGVEETRRRLKLNDRDTMISRWLNEEV